MKKLLLTLIVSFALCGSIFAQAYESHWPGFYSNAYENQGALVAAIMIDGVIIDATYPSWDALEVAFFVDDVFRGTDNYLYNGYVVEWGDPFPIIDGVPIYYDNPGEAVTVKMYDHINDIEYNECTVVYQDAPFEILTGDDNIQGWFDPFDVIFLQFTSSNPSVTLTKEIQGYEGEGGYYLIATPIFDAVTGPLNPAEVNGMLTGDYDLYYFDQVEDDEWRNYKANPFTLTIGQGFLYANQGGTLLEFTGTPNTDADVILSKTGGNTWEGWNLVGNPLTEATQINRPFYMMNEARTDVMPVDAGTEIPPMEGIFVEAETDGEVLTFTTTTAKRGNASASFNLSNGKNVIDRAIVSFGNEGQLKKLQLFESSKLYIPQDGTDYAVVSRDANGDMPLNFKAETTGTYTISFNADATQLGYIHLIDRLTGNNVDLLANPNYTFNGSPRDSENRFLVRFSEYANNDIFAYQNNDDIIVNGEGTMQVYDIMGRFVASYDVNGSKIISASEFSTGVYIFRMIGNEIKTQKIVVR